MMYQPDDVIYEFQESGTYDALSTPRLCVGRWRLVQALKKENCIILNSPNVFTSIMHTVSLTQLGNTTFMQTPAESRSRLPIQPTSSSITGPHSKFEDMPEREYPAYPSEAQITSNEKRDAIDKCFQGDQNQSYFGDLGNHARWQDAISRQYNASSAHPEVMHNTQFYT